VSQQDVEVTDAEDVLDEVEAAPQFSDLELEGDIAADYVEGLLDIADLDGDIDMDVEGDRAVVSVVGATLDELVGGDGEVLEDAAGHVAVRTEDHPRRRGGRGPEQRVRGRGTQPPGRGLPRAVVT